MYWGSHLFAFAAETQTSMTPGNLIVRKKDNQESIRENADTRAPRFRYEFDVDFPPPGNE